MHNNNDIIGLRLALGHQSRSGKDTFADYISATCGQTIVLSFAKKLYNITEHIQHTTGRKVEKDPKLLQLMGATLRKYYDDKLFVKLLMDDIDKLILNNPDVNIVVADMRFRVEMEALKERGFSTIKINRSNRPIDRDPNDISEVDLLSHPFDISIDNNGTLNEFYNTIDNLVRIECGLSPTTSNDYTT